MFGAERGGIIIMAPGSNVAVKVGGIQMVVNGWEFEQREVPVGSEDLARLTLPVYRHVIESFGCSRCMFESNFPVDKVSSSCRLPPRRASD
jgi:predicted TIM-barrel fold metal-dependent hydrolase